MLFYATETAREIYWPLSRHHLTRNDVANRSRAISHLLWLLCKADLSCLRAIFKLWAAKDLWRQGKFYYHRRPFVWLYSGSRRGSRHSSAIYLHSTAANKGELDRRHLSRADGERFLWTESRGMTAPRKQPVRRCEWFINKLPLNNGSSARWRPTWSESPALWELC